VREYFLQGERSLNTQEERREKNSYPWQKNFSLETPVLPPRKKFLSLTEKKRTPNKSYCVRSKFYYEGETISTRENSPSKNNSLSLVIKTHSLSVHHSYNFSELTQCAHSHSHSLVRSLHSLSEYAHSLQCTTHNTTALSALTHSYASLTALSLIVHCTIRTSPL
jgi:hypothetical protein